MSLAELDLTRFNKLISYNKGFSLHVFDDRYSRGYISMLMYEQEYDRFEKVYDEFNGGDSDNSDTANYFLVNKWYPAAAGKDFEDSFSKLVNKINSVDERDFQLWQTRVCEALDEYVNCIENNRRLRMLPETLY